MSHYIIRECVVCNAIIPVNTDKDEVTCQFCGSQFEIVRTHRNGKPSPGQLGWFVAGAVVGFLVGWPISRAALATTAKVTIGELEKKVVEWGERR